MSIALVAIMSFFGIFVFLQVSGDYKEFLQRYGLELSKDIQSESKEFIKIGDKTSLSKLLASKIAMHQDLEYILVLKKNPADKTNSGGRDFDVFASHIRENTASKNIDTLVGLHLSGVFSDPVVEQEDSIGFTVEIHSDAIPKVPKTTLEPAPGTGDQTDSAPVRAENRTEPTTSDLWGYVCVGMSKKQLQHQKGDLITTLLGIFLAALILYSSFIFLASTRIHKRLLFLKEIARRISEGNLSESVSDPSSDEIGMLADALNRITGNLNDMIRKVTHVSSSLSDAVERITASTEEVVQGAEYQVASVDETSSSMSEMVISLKGVAENVEILATSAEESSSSILEMAATNDEVADNISSLANSVEETTTNIEQMAHAIREVAKSVEDLSTTAEQTSTSMREMDVSISQVEGNANDTAMLGDEVRRDAERGSEAVKKTMQGISRISESTRNAFSAMEALGKKVQAIGQVLNVIDDVAEQTNLLALNAAIIAAQAGEHGKGFAVVADEIKDLAERTATSTNEIADLIRAVQTETKNVIESMQRGLKSVDEGVSLSGEAGQALGKILESATKSTNMIREIAKATVEQARGSKLVTDAMSRIAETVQQIASATAQQAKGTEQIMASAERMKVVTQHVHSSSMEQARGSKQITQAIENISEMVHHLNRAQKEQTKGSEQVMKAVEKIKEVAEHHSDSMTNMQKMVGMVAQQVETLRNTMSRFKL